MQLDTQLRNISAVLRSRAEGARVSTNSKDSKMLIAICQSVVPMRVTSSCWEVKLSATSDFRTGAARPTARGSDSLDAKLKLPNG